MISTLLFDLGGTLHSVKRTDASCRRFSEHLISRLSQYGIDLHTTPEELTEIIHKNGEEYKHRGEKAFTELPQGEIAFNQIGKGDGIGNTAFFQRIEEFLHGALIDLRREGSRDDPVIVLPNESDVNAFVVDGNVLNVGQRLLDKLLVGIRRGERGGGTQQIQREKRQADTAEQEEKRASISHVRNSV